MIFLSLQTAVVVSLILVVAVQYALALFCLLKLAYLDITKKEYVLWNLFILLIFFIGAAVFLVYWFKVKDTKRIPPYVPSADKDGKETAEESGETENGEKEEPDKAPENGENAEKGEKEEPDKSESGNENAEV